jgi:hypothetical protein
MIHVLPLVFIIVMDMGGNQLLLNRIYVEAIRLDSIQAKRSKKLPRKYGDPGMYIDESAPLVAENNAVTTSGFRIPMMLIIPMSDP